MNITQLPFPKVGQPWKNVELYETLHIEQWSIPKGTKVTIKQTQNFGFLILSPNTLDVRGFEIPKRVFKY
jgi:hypothetical protein